MIRLMSSVDSSCLIVAAILNAGNRGLSPIISQ